MPHHPFSFRLLIRRNLPLASKQPEKGRFYLQ
jgi:hypothetical protein